jgi:aspartyl protease family protein
MNRHVTRALLALVASLAAMTALAQEVALTGVLGSKALLVVDGTAPKGVAAGETFRGVKVIAIKGTSVEIEIQGSRQTLRMGEGPVALSSGAAAASGDNRRIVLQAGTNGHFRSPGQINGQTVNFLVDTGASAVSLSESDAQRIGLKYQQGQSVQMNTANGVTHAWLIQLDRVRLGDVEIYGVEAIVSPSSMPYVLLGNSFLTRFQMTRINDQMVLEKRY